MGAARSQVIRRIDALDLGVTGSHGQPTVIVVVAPFGAMPTDQNDDEESAVAFIEKFDRGDCLANQWVSRPATGSAPTG